LPDGCLGALQLVEDVSAALVDVKKGQVGGTQGVSDARQLAGHSTSTLSCHVTRAPTSMSAVAGVPAAHVHAAVETELALVVVAGRRRHSSSVVVAESSSVDGCSLRRCSSDEHSPQSAAACSNSFSAGADSASLATVSLTRPA